MIESVGPLAGLRVVDLGAGPATGLATMMLADFGARVLRYPDPGGSFRECLPSARMWLRGKAQGSDLDGDLAVARCGGRLLAERSCPHRLRIHP